MFKGLVDVDLLNGEPNKLKVLFVVSKLVLGCANRLVGCVVVWEEPNKLAEVWPPTCCVIPKGVDTGAV